MHPRKRGTTIFRRELSWFRNTSRHPSTAHIASHAAPVALAHVPRRGPALTVGVAHRRTLEPHAMALVDVSNDPAHARGAKAAGFSIPGLTKPALVAEKPAAKASKASKAAKTADGAAKATRKRAPGAKKAAALTTTPPPAASRAKMTAKENVSFAEAPADLKTPREPKTPCAPAAGFAEAAAAEDVAQQFKTPGNVTFAAEELEEDEEGHADDPRDDAGGACKRVSRRQHARPERFGEFKSWNSVQKGTLGTPGHGLLSKQAKLRLGARDEESEGSGTSTSSGKGGGESAEAAKAKAAKAAAAAAAAATPTTARFNAAASDAAAREVHERVEALMRMADAVLPVEDPAAAAAAANEKSLREQLSDSWNGQGYYAKLMTQMATPKKEGEKKDEEEEASLSEATGKANGNAANGAVSKKAPVASAAHAAPKQHPSAAAAPPAVAGSGGAGVAKKLGGGALASRATANAGWMLAGVVGASKPESPAFGAASEAGEALEALKAELASARAELAAAKEEAETLRSDAALAESEAESLGNTLESQTHQLRSKDAENKALKAELAQIKAKAAGTAAEMAEAIKQAVDAAVAKCVAEM